MLTLALDEDVAVAAAISGAPWNDIANGRADGAHKLKALRPSVTDR